MHAALECAPKQEGGPNSFRTKRLPQDLVFVVTCIIAGVSVAITNDGGQFVLRLVFLAFCCLSVVLIAPSLLVYSIAVLAFLEGIGIANDGGPFVLVTLVFLAFCCLPVVLIAPWLLAYPIVVLAFFEGIEFRLVVQGISLRPLQIVELVALPIAVLYTLAGPRGQRTRTAIDGLLILYLGANCLSLTTALFLERSLQITILLSSLIALYFVITRLVSSKEVFENVLKCFVAAGVAESLYGLYQLLAQVLNVHFRFGLPIGVKGVTHIAELGWEYGRSYGTFVEPDWFGASSMFFSLFFVAMWLSGPKNRRRKYALGAAICLSALLLSMVRATWLGFIAGFVFMILPSPFRHRSRILFFKALAVVAIGFVISATVMAFSAPLREVVARRFTSTGHGAFSPENIRFQDMKVSFGTFLQRPILGNGAGNFSKQPEYDPRIPPQEGIERRFDPSIITTVLSDTGIVGFTVFMLLAGKFYRYHSRCAAKMSSARYRAISLGLFGGVVGLFVSYVFTQGLWMPLTWVCLSLSVVSDRIGISLEPDGS